MAVSITLQEVPIGPAATFRSTINTNFEAIAEEFDTVYETMVNIVLSPTQPTNQKVGDFWFKDLSSSG